MFSLSRFSARSLSGLHAAKRAMALGLWEELHGARHAYEQAINWVHANAMKRVIRDWLATRPPIPRAPQHHQSVSAPAATFSARPEPSSSLSAPPVSQPICSMGITLKPAYRRSAVCPHAPVLRHYAGRPAACSRSGGLRGSSATRRKR